MKNLTVEQIVKLFKKHRPETLHDVFELGIDLVATDKPGRITMQCIGKGSYRRAYRINNLPLIVKFPCGEDDSVSPQECLEHACNEIHAWTLLKGKYKKLKKYCPEVYFMDEMTGVILMKEYDNCKPKGHNEIKRKASEEIEKVTDKGLDFYKNFVCDKDGNVTLLDWGLLGELTEWEEVET